MDYLKQIRQIAGLAGDRDDSQAPLISQQIISHDLAKSGAKAHYVHSNQHAKAVLKDCETFVQDRFLDEILKACNPTQVNWIQFFVDQSPEFNDGRLHTNTRSALMAELDSYAEHARMISANALTETFDTLQRQLTSKTKQSSSQVARQIIQFYFDTMFTGVFGSPVSTSESLLFAEDLFTPSLRLKRSLIKLNSLLDDFFCDYVPALYLEDNLKRLTILSMFLMASAPLANGITCMFNHLLNKSSPPGTNSDKWFSNYLMTPTIFVARRASKDCQLGQTQIKRNDRLYVFLSEFSGCPFSSANTLPFGFGKHLCPGLTISRIIMDTTLDFANTHQDILRNQLTPSELVTGLPTAFLVYA